MAFSDTLKELLDQGARVSRELASKAGEKAQELGSKVQELGEKGVLLLEVKQLESQARKLAAGLGAEAYKAFESGASSLDLEAGGVKTMLEQLLQVKDGIEKREAALQAK